MASNMFLYWGSGSVPCWRPMIVLEEKGLQGYGNKMISFSNKEHKGEDVTKLNSRGQVCTSLDLATRSKQWRQSSDRSSGLHLFDAWVGCRGSVRLKVLPVKNCATLYVSN